MRRSTVAVFGLVLFLILGATAMGGGGEDAVFEISGMTCGSCAAGIESVLGKTAGVVDARVSYEEGKAVVTFDDAAISVDDLVEAIESVGYQVRFLPGELAPANLPAGADLSCNSAEQTATASGEEGSLSDEELTRVVDYVVAFLVNAGDEVGPISKSDIEKATGLTIANSETGRVQTAVIAEMREKHPAILAKLEAGSQGVNRCAEYGACSLHGNLAGASGDLLEMYEREKAQDGRLYDDFPLPEFEAQDLEGNTVRSADLVGQRALVVLLAGHCNHCHDSLPILQEVQDTWGEGVRLVGVLVNSGSADSVKAWITHDMPRHEVWVYDDASLGDMVDSHLVPTYLFVDADGRVVEKLVGFKEKKEILAKVASFVTSPQPLDVQKVAATAAK